MKKILLAVIVLAIIAAGAYWYWTSGTQTYTRFTVAEIKHGRLEQTVGSTGTLQPREIVDVGAQVVGRVTSIGHDSNTESKIVDWGSEVEGPVFGPDGTMIKPGTLLAQIDPDLYVAQLNGAEASLASAQAAVRSAEAAIDAAKADLQQKTATRIQAGRDFNRATKLIKTDDVTQAEFDQFNAAHGVAEANFKSSAANIEVAQANLKTAEAQVKTAEAALKTAHTNLAYTQITAPVKGVVIDRRVNVGQTVVASLSAPSLFLIAKDLSKTQVWATVNEVDVGKIKIDPKGRKTVTFTVDAYPGRVYHGRVVPQGKLPFRLNATMNQNVVTYTVVVSVDDEENKDSALRPYMTCNLTFTVAEKDNALIVPNAALRWQPARNQIAPDVREAYSRVRGKKRSPTDAESVDRAVVWTAGEDGFVRFIEVRTGISDSVHTEVLGLVGGGDLPEHTQVITGETRVTDNRSNGANPFVATPFSTKKKE